MIPIIKFTLEDAYRLFMESVMYQEPTNNSCETVNSWVVMEGQRDLAKPMFGLTPNEIDSNEYFSRNNAGFPILISTIESTNFVGISDIIYFKRIQLGVVDQLIEDCVNCSPCEKRTVEKIYWDTEQLLRLSMAYISDVDYYEVKRTIDSAEVTTFEWHNNQIIIQLKAEGQIDSYINHSKGKLGRILGRNNTSIPATRWQYLTKRIYGVYVSFQLPIIMECTPEDFKLHTYKIDNSKC